MGGARLSRDRALLVAVRVVIGQHAPFLIFTRFNESGDRRPARKRQQRLAWICNPLRNRYKEKLQVESLRALS